MSLEILEREKRLFEVDGIQLTPDERSTRAEVMWQLYNDPEETRSLQAVGNLCGGLSKERVRQVLIAHGYDVRPALGSKKWREARKKLEQELEMNLESAS